MYQPAAEEKRLRPLSRQVFTEGFKQQNLGLNHPKKDQCNTCCSFKAGNLQQSEWQDHFLRKEEPRVAKEQEKDHANEKTMVLLLCPRLNASALYCKTNLAVHNFTICDMSTHNATMSGMKVRELRLPVSLHPESPISSLSIRSMRSTFCGVMVVGTKTAILCSAILF